MKEYYDRRAPEYDEWYLGSGPFARRERPGWHEEVVALQRVVAALGFARILDVACGTGFLTGHLRGRVAAVDHSAATLAIARHRAPAARLVRADAWHLPFADRSFDAVFTGHFYGHLHEGERHRFLIEARRVAPAIVVVDAAERDDTPSARTEERRLRDGSRYTIYKRFFTADRLAAELGGGRALHAGRWFVAVLSEPDPA